MTETPSMALDKLTWREREVLALLLLGYPNKEIARQIGIREITVKVRLTGVYRKLKVKNRVEAVRAVFDEIVMSPAAMAFLVKRGFFGKSEGKAT